MGQKALTYRRTWTCINILKSLDHMSFGVIMQEKLKITPLISKGGIV